MAKVTMPQLGESVAEGTIGKWLKQPGDHVDKYEPLLEVITDKVNAEVPSPFEGVLKEILAEEGATVPNNAEIAVIETSDEAGSTESASSNGSAGPAEAPATEGARTDGAKTESATPDGATPDSPKPAADDPVPVEAAGPTGSDESGAATSSDDASSATATAAASSAPAATSAPPTAQGDPDARMTPAVRRLLREHALNPEQIVGTGGGGRITRDDVLAVVEAIRTGGTAPAPAAKPAGEASQPAAATAAGPSAAGAATAPPRSAMPGPATVAFPEGADEALVPMTQMRKGIAAQMTRALLAPHAYVQMEVDVTRLVALREGAKKAYQAKEGISLSFVPFVVKASAEALKRNPTFNANWTEQGLLAKRRINIGVAVAVDDGLLVPVIRDADTLSIHGLNAAITDVANRARANKLRVDDFGGGTFTVDNTGYLGTNLVMPILNVPEVGIVTMEAITKRPVVQSTPDGDVIAIRPVMNMVLGVDHRANDGAGGAALLRDIKSWLEAVGPETPIY